MKKKNDLPSLKIPPWLIGGIVGLSFYLLMTYVINPLLNTLTSPAGHIIPQVIGAPILILSIPLLILYAYIGFSLDAIYQTGVGYESLGVFPLGVIFMQIASPIYFFFIGALAVKIYQHIKKK